jgi:hypothetical protein
MIPQVLVPFYAPEAITLQRAGGVAGRSPETVRGWCAMYDIGRRIGGRWAVSHPALLMFLDGDHVALKAYLSGDRHSERVACYFRRAGVPLQEIQKMQEMQEIVECA